LDEIICMAEKKTKQVLNVGQCDSDYADCRSMLESVFEARVERAIDIRWALELLCQREYDLVLVNRIIEATVEEGVDLVRKMRDSEFLRGTPVMLLSNFSSVNHGLWPWTGRGSTVPLCMFLA